MNTKSTTFLIFFVALSFATALFSLFLPFADSLNIKLYLNIATQTLSLINENQFLMFLSAYLLMHYLVINLLTDRKWKLIKMCAQKIIENTMWQGIILYMLYISLDKDVATSKECYLYIWLFCIGRILFSLGYLIGTSLKFEILRSPGFAISFGAEFGILFLALGINVDQFVPF